MTKWLGVLGKTGETGALHLGRCWWNSRPRFGALFLWLGVFFARGIVRWRVATPSGRAAAGTLLAGSFAIIGYSASPLSKPFAVYLPLFLGALVARGPDR